MRHALELRASGTPPHRKVAGLGLVLLTLMGVVIGVAYVSMHATARDVERIADRGAEHFAMDRWTESATSLQLALEQAYGSDDPDERVAHLAEWDMRAQQLLEQNDRELRALNIESLSWFEAAYAARSALADPTGTTPVDMATVRERYAGFQSGIEDTLVEHWDELIGQTSDTERSSSRFAQIVLVVGIVGFVIGIGVVHGTYRTSAAQDRELEERDAARAVHLRRSEIESRIGRASSTPARSATRAAWSRRRWGNSIRIGRPSCCSRTRAAPTSRWRRAAAATTGGRAARCRHRGSALRSPPG